MSVLPDHHIRAAIEHGRLKVDPWEPAMLQPASIDLRLGDTVTWVQLAGAPNQPLDPYDPTTVDLIASKLDEDHCWGWILQPGDLYLAATAEQISVPADLVGRVEGKSSLGRCGIQIHSTAGFIDPGFEGTITLELTVVLPTRLRPGMPIAQLSLQAMTGAAERPYGSAGLGSRYQHQTEPTPSRYHEGRR